MKYPFREKGAILAISSIVITLLFFITFFLLRDTLIQQKISQLSWHWNQFDTLAENSINCALKGFINEDDSLAAMLNIINKQEYLSSKNQLWRLLKNQYRSIETTCNLGTNYFFRKHAFHQEIGQSITQFCGIRHDINLLSDNILPKTFLLQTYGIGTVERKKTSLFNKQRYLIIQQSWTISLSMNRQEIIPFQMLDRFNQNNLASECQELNQSV